ncbi:MAG: EmrA family multidrug resistance transporter protein [Devosia sp.]|nr:EmrA family multidrug resistance transporter protein [Devosia sp.]
MEYGQVYVNRTEQFGLTNSSSVVPAMANDNDKVRRLPAARRAQTAAAPAPVEALEATPEAPHVVDAPEPAPAAPTKPKGGSRRRIVVSIIALLALAGAGWYGNNYYTTGRFMVSTDDAYIVGDITTISPKVTGYVTQVNVVANQSVKAGDTLVTLDDGDYRIARDQAQATIDTQHLTLARIDAQITGAGAAVTQAEAQKTALQAAQRNAQLAFDRSTELTARAVVSQADLDKATAALDQANANIAAGDAQVAAAQANIGVLQAQRAEAAGAIKSQELALQKAERDMSFTVLRAPYDGIVGNMAVQTGDLVSPGARLAAVVPVNALYVEANFKETQLANLVPGEAVTITVDALGADPIHGTVESLAPASGSVFSLLPAENATGNFTKVVQRVPVRIALPADALATGKLRAGLSVTIEADTRTIPASAN